MIKQHNKILLIQPRHIYAPPVDVRKYGHIYMPTSLLTIAALFINMGVEVEIVDENIESVNINHNLVGINLLGAPYIPSAIQFEKKLRHKFNDKFTLLIGGQIVSGLNSIDWNHLFSENTFNGNSRLTLAQIFNVRESDIPQIENISLLESYKLLKDKTLKTYLSHEFSFYLSQGCKHSCSFCSAKRSILLPGSNKLKRETEKYRNINIALSDFEYLLKKAQGFKIQNLLIYLSNLDLFQSPLFLSQFAKGLLELKREYNSISFKIRGLSTSRSFLKTHFKYPQVISDMVDAGLFQIGFGIDGATPTVYKETRKPQTVKESLDAVRISKLDYGINPEILMVFGHNDKEDESALKLAVSFCKEMYEKYGAIPRPHVAKDIVPGNDGWNNPKNEKIVREFYNSPMLFQNLDFTAIPSPITHPDSAFRDLVTKYYKRVCELPNSLTQYVLPESPNMDENQITNARLHNQGRYDI